MFGAALVTVIIVLAIIACHRPLSRLIRERGDGRALQASHDGNPLRFGGIAIFAGLAAGMLTGPWDNPVLPVLLIASAVPTFLAGLWEDLGYGVSPRHRLAAAFVSAALAALLLGVWVTRANLPGLDLVMAVAPLGLILTITASAGFCHATNLVDGMNGLASVVIIAAAVGLAVLAVGAGQGDLTLLAALLGAAMMGFFVLNWPFGIILMGDAGAYGIGHMLIWVAFLLADRVSGIAVPALVLILFWPFADTLHSIARRVAGREPVFAPDRMHLHQKVRRCIEIAWLSRDRRKLSNPLTTLVLAPMIVAPVIAGVVLAHDARAAWIAVLMFATIFALSHVAVTRLAIRGRRRALCASPCAQEVEYSPLCCDYTEHGRDIEVRIYRVAGEHRWRLALINSDCTSVEWLDRFITDRAARTDFDFAVRKGTAMRRIFEGEQRSPSYPSAQP